MQRHYGGAWRVGKRSYWKLAVQHTRRNLHPFPLLGAEAVIIALKWFLRTQEHFCCLVISFIDSQSVPVDIIIGGNGAVSLNCICNRVSILRFVSPVRFKIFFIASKGNLADATSLYI